MDQTYNDVFETLFSEFPRQHIYDSGLDELSSDVVMTNLREVRNAIVAAVSSLRHKKIRPDAKLFLMSNYYHMVLLPVLLVRIQTNASFPLDDNFKKQISN